MRILPAILICGAFAAAARSEEQTIMLDGAELHWNTELESKAPLEATKKALSVRLARGKAVLGDYRTTMRLTISGTHERLLVTFPQGVHNYTLPAERLDEDAVWVHVYRRWVKEKNLHLDDPQVDALALLALSGTEVNASRMELLERRGGPMPLDDEYLPKDSVHRKDKEWWDATMWLTAWDWHHHGNVGTDLKKLKGLKAPDLAEAYQRAKAALTEQQKKR